MAATGLQVNWINVSFDDVDIDRVTNVSVGDDNENIKFKGDDATRTQVIVNVNSTQMMTVTSGNEAVILGLPSNAVGTLTATHKDARGASGGGIVYELNCIVGSKSGGGGHAQFSSAQATFEGFSTDGVTNPLSFTRV